MLTEICAHLKNYFDYSRFYGDISISGGAVSCRGVQIDMDEGQYFALFRPHYCLGIFRYGDELEDRTVKNGSVWLMDIPPAIFAAIEWAEKWNELNGGADSAANSPFQSESFGGYSYSKGSTYKDADSAIGASVFDQAQFKAMLSPYQKMRV